MLETQRKLEIQIELKNHIMEHRFIRIPTVSEMSLHLQASWAKSEFYCTSIVFVRKATHCLGWLLARTHSHTYTHARTLASRDVPLPCSFFSVIWRLIWIYTAHANQQFRGLGDAAVCRSYRNGEYYVRGLEALVENVTRREQRKEASRESSAFNQTFYGKDGFDSFTVHAEITG